MDDTSSRLSILWQRYFEEIDRRVCQCVILYTLEYLKWDKIPLKIIFIYHTKGPNLNLQRCKATLSTYEYSNNTIHTP